MLDEDIAAGHNLELEEDEVPDEDMVMAMCWT